MGNLANEMANRGSKLCMQICVNNIEDDFDKKTGKIVRKSRKHLLDDLIGHGNITWLSPLASDRFKEYYLETIAKAFPIETGLGNMDWSFWKSTRKPQWDAVGIGEDDSLIIVEAKAHTSEIEGSGSDAKGDSYLQKKEQIETIMGEDPVWMGKYYQTANRVLYLSKIKEYYGTNRNVVLVFLNFINDVTLIPESKEIWDEYLQRMKQEHPLPDSMKDSIKYIFMDIWKDKGV